MSRRSRSARQFDVLTVRVVVSLALMFLAQPCRGQLADTGSVPTRSLNISFADGRVTTHPIQGTGEVWTPAFPRLGGPVPTRDGQPLSALGVSWQTEGDVVVATVSLFYGLPHRSQIKVTVLTVSEQPAAVDELRAYGVQPVRLSLAKLGEGTVVTPEVSTASKALSVTVAPLPPGASRYQFTVANTSSRTLTAFRFLAYRGNAVAIDGMRRGGRGEALVAPGGVTTFVLTVGSGSVRQTTPGPPAPITRVAIIAVLWKDGFEGDRTTADREQEYRRELRGGLQRALPVLRQAAGQPAKELRSRLAELSSDEDRGTRQIADALLRELTKEVGPLPLDRWLATTIPAYEQWLARLSDRRQ